MTSCPCCSSAADDLGRNGDPQLAAGGEDVDRAVLEQLEEYAVAARRLGQPVDLLLERDHLVAGIAQGLGQPLVALGQARGAGLRLGQPVFEQPDVARRLGDFRPQQVDLLLEVVRAVPQVLIVSSASAISAVLVVFAGFVDHAVTSRSAVSARQSTLHSARRRRDGSALCRESRFD